MTDNQFNQLFNPLTELLEGIERLEQIFYEMRRDKPKSVSDDNKEKSVELNS